MDAQGFATGMKELGKFGDVRIIYEPRGSEMCVVTFSHMDFTETGEPYWGRRVLEKLGLSAVGVVCDQNTWFPSWHLAGALLQSGRPWLHQHSSVVSYGSSMGAYAALRHGRSVGATAAIALAPQASIHPRLCAPGDVRYANYFRKHLHWDASVRKVPLHSFALFDPRLAEDAFQATLLQRLAPQVQLVPAHHMGHEVGHVFDSGSLFAALRAACAGDRWGLFEAVTSGRRMSERRAFGLGQALLPRRRELANRVVHSRWADLSPWWRKRWVELGGDSYTPAVATEFGPTLVS